MPVLPPDLAVIAPRSTFAPLRTLRQERRAVLFIDEIESLVPSRRRNRSTIMQRVISQILGEVDGLSARPPNHALLLIGATNEPDMIDHAMTRPGRMDACIYVGKPNHEARRQILSANLEGRPVGDDVDSELLTSKTEGMSGAEIKNLVERAVDKAFLSSLNAPGPGRPICFADFGFDPLGPRVDASVAHEEPIACRLQSHLAPHSRSSRRWII